MADIDLLSFIQNNFPAIKPSIELLVGAVISSMFLRKNTRVETDTQEFEKIKVGKIKEAVDELVKSGKMSLYELCKTKNYLEIARKADNIKYIEVLPAQNFDWHTRFFEACGNISNEEMQAIWAKLLAGEIEHPGSFSLRTLECLRNMSKEEAILFQKVCDASIKMKDTVVLPQFGHIMEQNQITFENILELEDCGLIKSDSNIILEIEVGDSYSIVTYDEKLVLVVKNKSKNITTRLNLPQYMFTSCGTELYNIVGRKMDIQRLCIIMQQTYSDYQFKIGQVISNNNGKIGYVISEVIKK